jgi:SnoaL-like domain
MVRWPGVWAAISQAVFPRLPPRSRLRRVLLRRAALSGWSAWARGDLDLMLVRYSPDCLFEPPPEFVAAGMRGLYRGHAGAREQEVDLRESFERLDVTPLEIIDGRDRLVVLGRFHVRARGSGVELDSPAAVAYRTQGSLVVGERIFLDWDAALRAAGFLATAAASDRSQRVASTP